MDQGCTCCPCHSQCMATLALGWEQGDGVCCSSVCPQHCTGLQPGPATAEGGDLHPELAPLMAPLHPGLVPQEGP